MRRVRGILVNVVTTLSLLLFIATLAAPAVVRTHAIGAATAAGRTVFHVAVTDLGISVTRIGPWASDDVAGRAARQLGQGAFRPYVTQDYALEMMLRYAERLRIAGERADQLPPGVANLDRNPLLDAAWDGKELAGIDSALEDWAARQARISAGSPLPVVVAAPPDARQRIGVTVEHGAARFPVSTGKWRARYLDLVPFDAVTVPFWMFAVAFAIIPAGRGLAILASLRRTRRRLGAPICAACGYDLRATPDQCPECGQVPARR